MTNGTDAQRKRIVELEERLMKKAFDDIVINGRGGYIDKDYFQQHIDCIFELRTRIAELETGNAKYVEALRRVNHTLICHGHIDANTPLHEFIREVLPESETENETNC